MLKEPKLVGRPQAVEVTDRILRETLVQIAEQGFHRFKTETVAVNSQTSKQALYRRWPSKAGLAAAAIEHALAQANPDLPDGPLHIALETTLTAVARLLCNTPFGGAVRALVAAHTEPELVAALARVEASRRQLLLRILARAAQDGEYPRGRDPEVDVDTLLGAIYFRFLVRSVPIDASFVAAIVANWCAALGRLHPLVILKRGNNNGAARL